MFQNYVLILCLGYKGYSDLLIYIRSTQADHCNILIYAPMRLS